MKVYIATKINNANNGIKLGYKLQKLGIEVTSRWLECEGDERPDVKKEDRGHDARWRKFADKWCKIDLEDVAAADALIILAVDDGIGTWVEFGDAIGLRKPIYYVGSQHYTVFCHLSPNEYPILYFDKVEDLVKHFQINASGGFKQPPGFDPTLLEGLPPDLYGDVVDFHDKFGVPFSAGKAEGYKMNPELQQLKLKHIQEEFDEYKEALGTGDMEQAFDALIDLTYVVLGAARAHNFPFNQGWKRVHTANMGKIRAQKASDSKRGSAFDIVKPAGWKPAPLSDLLESDIQAATKQKGMGREDC